MAETNPNGANQFSLDPRQQLCWERYANPGSDTFGNATQSALSVGYEKSYAETITVTEWFKAKVRKLNLKDKSEKVLEETLDLDPRESGKLDSAVSRLKFEASKFGLSTLGKDDGYSQRSELTGKDGISLTEKVELTPELLTIIRKAEDEMKKHL